jgi:hypothetical protein
MAQSRDESSPSRIELVVLGCLSQGKPPTDAELGEAVQQLALPRESADAARRRAVELLGGLVRRGWVAGDEPASTRTSRSKAPGPRGLTDNGKRVLRNAFQLGRTPTWSQVRNKHFPSMAIGVPPGSEITKKACTETGLMAAVLAARFGISDAWTPLAVCDALIAKALGMPPGKLTLERMRTHVISHGIDLQAKDAPSPGSKSYANKFGAWLACSAVGATGAKSKMARALGRRWVCEEPHPLGTPMIADRNGRMATPVTAAPLPPPMATPLPAGNGSTAGNGNTAGKGNTAGNGSTAGSGDMRTPAPGSGARTSTVATSNAPKQPTTSGHNGSQLGLLDIRIEGKLDPAAGGRDVQPPTKNLLEAVREAISRVGAEGRFGEKVYVSAIWRTIERERKVSGLSLDHFTRWLVGANRDGWLVLARADLIGAMDPKQISESEINDRGATFHFVLDQRNGVSPLLRESHAG